VCLVMSYVAVYLGGAGGAGKSWEELEWLCRAGELYEWLCHNVAVYLGELERAGVAVVNWRILS
jgi:hypothetical protein